MPQVVNIQGVGKVNFPDGMTAEQIHAAIEKDILPQAQHATAPVPESAADRPNFLERLGRGTQDVVDRLAQLTVAAGEKLGLESFPKGLGDIMTGQMNEENALYTKGRGPNAGFDGARLAGNIGMTAPLALIPGGQGVAGRAALGAIQGAASGALQYDPTNSLSGTAKNVATGAVVGAVTAPVMGAVTDKAGKLIQKIAGRLKGTTASTNADDLLREIPELADLEPSVRRDLIAEAQKQIKATGALDAEQLGRKANLVAQGVTPTKSMITRNPRDWTLERNLQKLSQSPDDQLSQVGQELTGVYQANDQALLNRIASMGKGLPKGTQEAHGMAVMQSLDDLAAASQKDVSDLYNAVRATKGDQLASDARNLAATLEDLRDSAYADKLITSVANKLRRFGMLDANGNLTNKTLTVTQAEELRKFVNRLPNDFGKGDLIKAIDADVLTGMGEDAFGVARDAAKKRFESLANPATQKALATLGELTQGKAAQNFIKSQVIDAADQDVASLVGTLQKLPSDKADEALNSLRAGILQHLQDKAVNDNSGKFSGAAFNKALEQVGERKLIQIFGVPKYMELRNFARAALDATYEPPYAAVNNSNTAPMLMSLMQRARAIPGVPLIVTDEAAKIAARSGYRSQLADTLAARSAGKLPQLPASINGISQALRAGAAPASYPAFNQFRQSSDQRAKKRQ